MIKITNDTSTLNGALTELGETMADNLTAQGVTASASDGLTTLANKILDIPVGPVTPVIYEDDCTIDNTSDYTFIATRNNATATLTFNSNGYYEYRLTRTESEGFIVIPATGIDPTDSIKIEYDTYKEDGGSYTFGNIGGITVYEDDNNWATQKGNSVPDNLYFWGKKTNGTFTEGSVNHAFPSAQQWIHITVYIDGTTLQLVSKDQNDTTYTVSLQTHTRTNNTKYGIPISWVSRNTHISRLKNIKITKIE